MNKLWKTYTILAIVLFLENIVLASQPLPLTARVVSQEVNNVTGRLRITLEVVVQDSIYLRDTRFKDHSRDNHLSFPPWAFHPLLNTNSIPGKTPSDSVMILIMTKTTSPIIPCRWPYHWKYSLPEM